jgi:hypothetical protein
MSSPSKSCRSYPLHNFRNVGIYLQIHTALSARPISSISIKKICSCLCLLPQKPDDMHLRSLNLSKYQHSYNGPAKYSTTVKHGLEDRADAVSV